MILRTRMLVALCMHAVFAHSFQTNSFSTYKTIVNIILFIEMHNIFSMGWAYLWHELQLIVYWQCRLCMAAINISKYVRLPFMCYFLCYILYITDDREICLLALQLIVCCHSPKWKLCKNAGLMLWTYDSDLICPYSCAMLWRDIICQKSIIIFAHLQRQTSD